MQHLKNIYFLGIKEIIELIRDKCLLFLILFTFSAGVYVCAIGSADPVIRTPISVVDNDNTQLSKRITDAFLPPYFLTPKVIRQEEADIEMDKGLCTFVLTIPPDFQKNVLAGKGPEIMLSVDATCMTQAFVGSGYIQQIIDTEISNFVQGETNTNTMPAQLVLRNKFNENLTPTWFGGVNQLVSMITMLSIVLIGAALIRERERGTLEHLLVMPVETFEIMCAKIWAMMFVVLIAAMGSVIIVLQGFLEMPIDGSLALFAFGVILHLFAVTSLGIFLSCIAQNMPQLGLFCILLLMPMNMLSGGMTPRESMPAWTQNLMLASPTTHFVCFCQQILFRGAGLDVVWKPFLYIFIIGMVLFCISLRKFKRSATS